MYRRWMRALIAIVILAAVFFLHWYEPARWPPLANEFLHSLHGPGFGLLALAAYWSLGERFTGLSRYLVAALIATAVGLAAEASQIPGPRSPQVRDLIVNTLGVVAALGTLMVFDRQFRHRLKGLLRLLTAAVFAICLVITLLPSLWFAYAFLAQVRALPALMTFEHQWEQTLYSQPGSPVPELTAPPPGWPAGGLTTARNFESGQWGLLLVLRPYPNWQGYSRISFVAASATGGEIDVGVAVRDFPPDDLSASNRFYKVVTVGPVPGLFSISFDEISTASDGRPFDFANVDAFILSAASPGDGIGLLIDDIRLE